MQGLLTEKLAVLGTIDPDAYGTGTQGSDWMDMKMFFQALFALLLGTLGSSATIDFKVQEAKTAAGGDAQDLSGKAISQLTEAGTDSDKQALINVRADELSDGYRYVRGVLTIGVAASDVGLLVLGGDPSFSPASNFDLSSVDEIVT